jgi:structure-specific recognition protein 1
VDGGVPAIKAKGKPGPKSTAPKKVRDPDAPKRPMSAFLLYCQTRRKDFVTQNPTVTGRAILTAIAAEWKAMSPEQKQPYESSYQDRMHGWRDAKEKYDGDGSGDPGTSAAGAAGKKPATAVASTPPPQQTVAVIQPKQPYVAPPMIFNRTSDTDAEGEHSHKKKRKDKDKHKHGSHKKKKDRA